jgi:uncharacterized protein (DUF983 family)
MSSMLVIVTSSAVIRVASQCPACRAGAHDRRHILMFKRSNLCATDQATYDAADLIDRQRAGGRR